MICAAQGSSVHVISVRNREEVEVVDLKVLSRLKELLDTFSMKIIEDFTLNLLIKLAPVDRLMVADQ